MVQGQFKKPIMRPSYTVLLPDEVTTCCDDQYRNSVSGQVNAVNTIFDKYMDILMDKFIDIKEDIMGKMLDLMCV